MHYDKILCKLPVDMGITGLLPLVKPLMKSVHISEYKSKRIAIDGYSWIHRAIYSIPNPLEFLNRINFGSEEKVDHEIESNEIPINGGTIQNKSIAKTRPWIPYCLNLLDLLLHHDISVTVVFDGNDLPAKRKTEESRNATRQENYQKGFEYQKQGDSYKARMYFQRAIEITPRMAGELIQEMKRLRPQVKCIVAPYEADAQLAYLSLNNIVDAVISEDSDNIPYGTKEILFKLDRSGNCQALKLKDIYSIPIDGFNLTDFTPEMVTMMCVASGCDYLVSMFLYSYNRDGLIGALDDGLGWQDSLKGFGLKTTYKIISKHRSLDAFLRYLRLKGLIPQEGTGRSTADPSSQMDNLFKYDVLFHQAMATFRHQVIFDPVLRKTCHLTPIAWIELHSSIEVQSLMDEAMNNTKDLMFLGQLIPDDSISQGIADGLIDPISKVPFNFPPDPVVSTIHPVQLIDPLPALKRTKTLPTIPYRQYYPPRPIPTVSTPNFYSTVASRQSSQMVRSNTVSRYFTPPNRSIPASDRKTSHPNESSTSKETVLELTHPDRSIPIAVDGWNPSLTSSSSSSSSSGSGSSSNSSEEPGGNPGSLKEGLHHPSIDFTSFQCDGLASSPPNKLSMSVYSTGLTESSDLSSPSIQKSSPSSIETDNPTTPATHLNRRSSSLSSSSELLNDSLSSSSMKSFNVYNCLDSPEGGSKEDDQQVVILSPTTSKRWQANRDKENVPPPMMNHQMGTGKLLKNQTNSNIANYFQSKGVGRAAGKPFTISTISHRSKNYKRNASLSKQVPITSRTIHILYINTTPWY